MLRNVCHVSIAAKSPWSRVGCSMLRNAHPGSNSAQAHKATMAAECCGMRALAASQQTTMQQTCPGTLPTQVHKMMPQKTNEFNFTMRALSSTRRQLLLSKGTGSAAQHRTGKHMIPCVFGAKKIVAVKLFVGRANKNRNSRRLFGFRNWALKLGPLNLKRGPIFEPQN